MSKTKFKNAQTIVTEDFLNSLYGGLEGSSEGASLPADDPKIKGHVHDGVKADGHASKVDLVSHVQNQLTNTNLADEAVLKRNVYRSTDPLDSNLIPHYEIDSDGIKHYYLGLGSFDLQSITDNGNETTNPVIIGNNDPNNETMYCTMFALNMPTTVDTSTAIISQKKDYALSLKLAMKELFSWKIDGPEKIRDPDSYTNGESISGSSANYSESANTHGIEQRMYHENFGYVGFVGNETKNFHLRVIGIGEDSDYESPSNQSSMLGSTEDDDTIRSYVANQALTFWYDSKADGEAYGRTPYGGVSSKVTKSDNSGDLIFSIKPTPDANLSKDYQSAVPPLIFKGQTSSDKEWPLFDVAKISKYGNMEIKRGNQFTKHSESMLNIKETFGIDENSFGPIIPIIDGASFNKSRNIASIRLEPLIGQNQSESPSGYYELEPVKFLRLQSEEKEESEKSYDDKSDSYKSSWMPDGSNASRPIVGHHNYIDLSSIMDSRTPNTSRPDSRSISADEDLVTHSNVFKFDRYFVEKTLLNKDDTHRALHNNTYTIEALRNSNDASNIVGSTNYYAKHAIPAVSPFAQNEYYTPCFMKVNIVDGDNPRDFYIPVCYPEGISSDSGAENTTADAPLANIPDLAISAAQKRSIDLGLSSTTPTVYVYATPNGSAVKKYYYPLYATRLTSAFNTVTFSEFPGVTFYYDGSKTQSEIENSSIPSSSDYPGITAYTGTGQQILQLLY